MTHRLFLAIPLPVHIREGVVQLQQHLPRSVSPETPGKLHLTLNFLGRVPHPKLTEIHSLINQTVKNIHPFTLTPSFLKVLSKRHGESLVYLSLAGDIEALSQLQKSLSGSLDRLTPQPRRFFPHVTIGRFKGRTSDFSLPPLDLPSFTVDRLILYESFLSRPGSRHEKLAIFMLKSGPQL